MPMRHSPKRHMHRQCEAYVQDRDDPSESRLCKRAASQEDRLCSYHAKMRHRINKGRYVITLSKKHVQPFRTPEGWLQWPKFVIGKVFNSREDAELWASLNGSLLWKIPDIKSYCIEPYRQVCKH